MRVRIAVLAGIAAAAAGCAPAHHRAWSAERRAALAARGAVRGARAEFAPGRFEDVFATTIDLLRKQGLEIVSCDPKLGAIVTAPAEVDEPCWGTTCLARQVTRVKLGYRRARLTLAREVWDPTLRAWTPSEDRSGTADVAHDERELVGRIIDASSTRQAVGATADLCAATSGRCRDAPCVARHEPDAAVR